MMVVLQIMDYAAPYKGNFICSILSLEKQIDQEDGRLIYLFPLKAQILDWVIELQNDERKVYFIDNSFFSKTIKFRNLRCINKIVRKEQVNIIHTHFIAYNFTLFLLRLFISHRVKIIGHFHNQFNYPNNIFTKIKVFLNNLTFDLNIGVGDSVAEKICKAGINPAKVIYVQNAIDFNRLDTFEKIRLTDSNIQKAVLMFGWHFYIKGVDIAIEAIRQLNNENNEVLLAISLSGGKELFEKEIIKRLGSVPLWIKLLDPREDVATYYNAADIFLSASREEGLNYSVIEAAYCNCGVVISQIPGNPQDIPYTKDFKVESIQELKSSIIELLEMTRSEIEQINKIQKEYVIKNYELNKWGESIIGYYLLLNQTGTIIKSKN